MASMKLAPHLDLRLCCMFTGVTMAYVNPSLTGHKTSAAADARQREYLLDMIDHIVVIYCHLLDVKPNYKRVAVHGNWSD